LYSYRQYKNVFSSFISQKVLNKTLYVKKLREYKSVIALPDFLFPTFINSLHDILGHVRITTKLNNFQTFLTLTRPNVVHTEADEVAKTTSKTGSVYTVEIHGGVHFISSSQTRKV
jgi:hypothetical protein